MNATNVVPFPARKRENPNGYVIVMPSEDHGGCWMVSHMSRSGDSAQIVGRWLKLDDAISEGRVAAAEMGADFADGVSI